MFFILGGIYVNFKYIFSNYFLAFCISTFIIISAVFSVCMFKPLYYLDINTLNLQSRMPISVYEIKKNYSYAVDYILEKTDDNFSLPSLPSSENGKTHFYEVRMIFKSLRSLWIITFGISILYGLFKIINKDYLFFKYSGNILITFSALIVLASLFNFNYIFTLFHKLFFNNDYWIFNSSLDPIILLLPEKFFYHCSVIILCITSLSGILLKIIYKISRKSNW
nr:TIGR01906 family membrane protein [Clostridium senegalense]